MHIVYFNMNTQSGAVSIKTGFTPLIETLSQKHKVEFWEVPYIGSNPIKMIKNILFVRRHSTKTGINHITGDIHYGIIGLLGRKSVLTIHDDYAIRTARKGWLDKIFKWIFWIVLPIQLADAVVCTNDSVKRSIYRIYKSKKLQVITHQAVPEGLYPKGKTFDKECPTILQIGTDTNKNLETTLEVIRGLHCKLMVLKEMTIEQEAKAKQYQINYVNKYNLPFKEVIRMYDESDIIVFPSLFEGMGAPIYEGQAAGKPVITTNRDPMNWVAGDGAVLLDDPKNIDEYRMKLFKIINDDDYRQEIIKNGIENAKRFSLDKVVSSYMELYSEVLKS